VDNVRAVIPDHVLKLFWDADKSGIDVEKHARYIICRVLDFGDTAEVRWLFDTYGEDVIREVVASNPHLHPKSLNYWRRRFGLAVDDVLADRVADKPDV
jgi:hypothetical protein